MDELTWRQLWVETAAKLGDAQHARWLVQEASGLDGIDWALSLDEFAGGRAVARLDAMVERRQQGEPIQYVLGHWEFRDLDLMVDRRVLIPRPETELVVDAALECLESVESSPAVVVDLGTGSGAIALSIACEVRPGDVQVWAVDESPDALHVARANLAGVSSRHGTHVRLAEGSWFDALPRDLMGQVDVVVTNPPYVAAFEELPPSVADWEPNDALVAGETGLECWTEIVRGSVAWLRPGGWLVGEIGSTQGPSLRELAARVGFVAIEIRRDLTGLDRIVVARKAP